MEFGFLKVAAATPYTRLADCMKNAEEIVKLTFIAEQKGAAAVVFPELSITGYTCGDLFFQTVLQNRAKESLREIISATKLLDILCVVGLPLALDRKSVV